MGTASRPFCAVIFHIPELELGTKEFAKGMTTDLLKETCTYLDMFLYAMYVPVRRDPLPKAYWENIPTCTNTCGKMSTLPRNGRARLPPHSSLSVSICAGGACASFLGLKIHSQAGAPIHTPAVRYLLHFLSQQVIPKSKEFLCPLSTEIACFIQWDHPNKYISKNIYNK